MGIGGNDWVLVVGWAVNATLALVGMVERTIIYAHDRAIENDPRLPTHLRAEAGSRRVISVRRVWLKFMMTVISVLETAVVWDRWWTLDYDLRDVAVCLVMTAFLIWMLTWRDP